MKRRFLGLPLLFAALAFGQEFKLGSAVSDFPLTDIKGNSVNYSALKGDTTVIIFVSVQCPVSNSYNDRMNQLYKEYSAKGVHFVFVNSNFTESPEAVAAHIKSAGLTFPVYKDMDSTVAAKFDAKVTPEVFVMDSKGVIQYHGAIDDNGNVARIKNHSLRLALDAVLNKAAVQTAETKAFGCTIKRKKRPS